MVDLVLFLEAFHAFLIYFVGYLMILALDEKFGFLGFLDKKHSVLEKLLLFSSSFVLHPFALLSIETLLGDW